MRAAAMRGSGEQATVRGQQCEDSSGEKATVSEQRSESSSVRATV